jgi:hypothetical protein
MRVVREESFYNIFDAALPFGGFKESGWGREMGHEVLDNYLETTTVCIQLLNPLDAPAHLAGASAAHSGTWDRPDHDR